MGTTRKKDRRYEGYEQQAPPMTVRPNAVHTKGFGRGRRIGYRKGPNSAEATLCKLADAMGVELSRRGYPDYAVIESGEIVGFIEVKPKFGRGLKIAQTAFARMCQRYGIPFCRWYPGAALPDFFRKCRTKWPNVPMN